LCAIPAGLAGIVWGGAHLAAAIGGGRVVPYGTGFVLDLIHGQDRAAWPGVPQSLAWGCTAGIAAVLVAAFFVFWLVLLPRVTSEPGDPLATLSSHRRQHEPLMLPAVRKKAVELRAPLKGTNPRTVAPEDAGMVLGSLLGRGGRPGPVLYSSWEESECDVMGPRSGKTTARAIPLTRAAPGAALVTSNKPDLWAATVERRQKKGRTWLFDPCNIAHQPQSFWIDLLGPVQTVEAAHRLAGHFVGTVDDPGKKDIWGPAASTLLTCLFLAASTSGRTMRDVAMWLDQPGMPAPATLLADAGFTALSSSLVGTQNGAFETRDGIYETARTAAKSLRDDQVVRWVTPGEGLPRFTAADFPATTDTLYLLSESASYASPLIAAATDAVIRAGLSLAQRSGGRLPVPMLLILDEACNICRIGDLPNLYSYLGSHGVCPLVIMQSYEQGVAVWGESGMAALWGASTVKLIGAGVDSPRLARELSELVGQHEVTTRSIGLGGGQGATENLSYQRRAILEAADVRAMQKGRALLLTSGSRPAVVKLSNWFSGPDAARISAEIKRAVKRIQDGAISESQHQPEPVPAAPEEPSK
jgi:type IV secretory pathway TraG/TraD family ATPase VirD4